MSRIGISYTPSSGAPIYNFVLDNFGGPELPRSYQQSAEFSQSANGASIIVGPAYRQKYQWVISTIMPKADAAEFDEMVRAWDLDRASGRPAACGVTDETFGDSVTASAVFATMPTYVRQGPQFFLVSFGLTEV